MEAWEEPWAMPSDDADSDLEAWYKAKAEFDANPITYTLDEVETMINEGEEDPYRPIHIDLDDPMVVHPERTPEGTMIWDDEGPDDGGSVYDRYATR